MSSDEFDRPIDLSDKTPSRDTEHCRECGHVGEHECRQATDWPTTPSNERIKLV